MAAVWMRTGLPRSMNMWDWIIRVAALLGPLVLVASGPFTERRWRQASLIRLTTVVDKVPDGPAKRDLARQVQREAAALAAMYRIQIPRLQFAVQATLGAFILAAGVSGFASVDRSDRLAFIAVGLIGVCYSIIIWRSVRIERDRYILAGCPAYFPHTLWEWKRPTFHAPRLLRRPRPTSGSGGNGETW